MVARKKVSPVTLMAEIAIMAAAGFVLDELAGAIFKGVFVNGGSIGIAMVCVVLMSYRRGPIAGFAVGFIMGIFDLLTGPYMIASSPGRVFLQVMLDYVLAYPLVGMCFVFKKAFDQAENRKQRLLFLELGVLVGTLAKLFAHFLAGILFWADPSGFAWGLTNMNPVLYCFLYNAAFALPSGIISGIVMGVMLFNAPRLYLVDSSRPSLVVERRATKRYENVMLGIIMVASLAIFGYFMYRYVASFYYGDYGPDGSEISFDADSMMVWICAALLFLFALFALLRGKKGKYRESGFIYQGMFMGGLVITYGLARLIRAYIKGKDAIPYYIWMAGGLAFLLIFLVYLLLKKKRMKANAQEENKPVQE